ncbi:hypothetical protein TcarDRAFT_1399 [Thermosinus carboxydivorans Nor1]|uniref:Uncharacterized protein n=1 Tax=Thermosinus carboxydivorans Nor1 TaxID=401526 RepID=A1HRN5_9FIRM|nr:hypothetical protein TcarDRAFT_1399 [Thermosinus carboxydivorans Nor1]
MNVYLYGDIHLLPQIRVDTYGLRFVSRRCLIGVGSCIFGTAHHLAVLATTAASHTRHTRTTSYSAHCHLLHLRYHPDYWNLLTAM